MSLPAAEITDSAAVSAAAFLCGTVSASFLPVSDAVSRQGKIGSEGGVPVMHADMFFPYAI